MVQVKLNRGRVSDEFIRHVEGVIDEKGGSLYVTTDTEHEHEHPTGKLPELRSRTENRFWEKVDVGGEDECWEWRACTLQDGGYGAFYSGGTRRAHRFAWELVHGEIPAGKQINHECDNRQCVNPDHLYVGTQQENARDAVRRERHPDQLPVDTVREIRIRYAVESVTQTELADTFNVSQSVISRVVRGDAYDCIDTQLVNNFTSD